MNLSEANKLRYDLSGKAALVTGASMVTGQTIVVDGGLTLS